MLRAPLLRASLRSRSLSSAVEAADAFSQLEFAMWQKGAQAYSETFAGVTKQVQNALLDAAGVPRTAAAARRAVYSVQPAITPKYNAPAHPAAQVQPAAEMIGEAPPPFRLLDIACGPGSLSAAALERGASEVHGVDSSSRMVELAQAAVPSSAAASFVVGDAQALPVDDSSFDAVIVSFGLLHLPRPERCLAECYRALKPGGRLSFSVWDDPSRALGIGLKPLTGFQLITEAIATHGDATVSLPAGPDGQPPLPFFHFAEEENAKRALAAAGFDAASVSIEHVPTHAALEHADALFEYFATATARTRATLEMQSKPQLEAIRAAVAAEVAARFGGCWYMGARRGTSASDDQTRMGTDAPLYDGKPTGRRPFSVPMPAVVASAVKPASP